MDKIKLVVILGATASGKSKLALDLAELFSGEIISADSMQVYKHMDIGTAKPSRAERAAIPHHLIDVVEPDEEFTAASFRQEASRRMEEIRARGRNPFVAGGTGLYIRALTKGIFEGPEGDKTVRDDLLREAQLYGRASLYEKLKEADPVSAERIHPNNLRRVVRALEVYYLARRPISDFHREHAFAERPYDTLFIGLEKERARLYEDIDQRVDEMMERGLVDETRGLLEMGYSPDLKPMGALGYKEVVAFLKGETTLEEATRLIKRNTRHYAKRQITWFRKDPEIRWFPPEERSGIIGEVKGHLG